VSQDEGDRATGNQLRDALSLFMSELRSAAYEALQLVDEAEPAESSHPAVDTARLQGFDDNLTSLQSRIIRDRELFSSPSVPDYLVLDRLNRLRSQAQQAIKKPERSGFSRYLEHAAGIIDLLADEPRGKEIRFFMETLRLALDGPPAGLPASGPEPAAPVSRAPRQQVKVFVVAGEAGRAAAEELAYKLEKSKVGESPVTVSRSWDLVGELSKQPLVTARSAVRDCHYGALVLVADEATVDVSAATVGNIIKGRLRLSPDLDFLLGLMVGHYGVERTFMVLPESQSEQPALATLLVGMHPAKYDPAKVTARQAMSGACTEIIWSIGDIEEKLTAAPEKVD
jgi:hypothetical protein